MPNLWTKTTQKIAEAFNGPRTKDTEFDAKVEEMKVVEKGMMSIKALVQNFLNYSVAFRNLCREISSSIKNVYASNKSSPYLSIATDISEGHVELESHFEEMFAGVTKLYSRSSEWSTLFANAKSQIANRETCRKNYDHYDEKMEKVYKSKKEKAKKNVTESTKEIDYMNRNEIKYKKATEEYVKSSEQTFESIGAILDKRYNLLNPIVADLLHAERIFYNKATRIFDKYEGLDKRMKNIAQSYEKPEITYDACKYIRGGEIIQKERKDETNKKEKRSETVSNRKESTNISGNVIASNSGNNYYDSGNDSVSRPRSRSNMPVDEGRNRGYNNNNNYSNFNNNTNFNMTNNSQSNDGLNNINRVESRNTICGNSRENFHNRNTIDFDGNEFGNYPNFSQIQINNNNNYEKRPENIQGNNRNSIRGSISGQNHQANVVYNDNNVGIERKGSDKIYQEFSEFNNQFSSDNTRPPSRTVVSTRNVNDDPFAYQNEVNNNFNNFEFDNNFSNSNNKFNPNNKINQKEFNFSITNQNNFNNNNQANQGGNSFRTNNGGNNNSNNFTQNSIPSSRPASNTVSNNHGKASKPGNFDNIFSSNKFYSDSSAPFNAAVRTVTNTAVNQAMNRTNFNFGNTPQGSTNNPRSNNNKDDIFKDLF